MTAQVLETQAATELEADAALAGLTPEIRAAAEELGLFGLSVAEVIAEVTEPIQQAAQPVSALQQRLDEMTAQILDTRFATDLETEAYGSLIA